MIYPGANEPGIAMAWLFCRALCQALLRVGEIRIERQRLVKSNNGALVLIEQRQVSPTISQHSRIRRQNLSVYNIILCKSDRPISQSAHLEGRVRCVMKALVSSGSENQSLRHELIALRDPPGQVPVRLVGDQHIVRDVNRREPDFIPDD